MHCRILHTIKFSEFDTLFARNYFIKDSSGKRLLKARKKSSSSTTGVWGDGEGGEWFGCGGK